MPALTPQFVMDLESRMRHIQENEYVELAQHLWWDLTTKTMKSGSRREIVTFVLNSAELESTGKSGNIAFDNMSIVEHEFENGAAGKGLKISRPQFDDLDGNGIQLATDWSAQMGAQFAYWPQKQTALALKNGHLASSLSYDAKPFFATDHPLNPVNDSPGTYSNLFTGVPIDVSVSADVALTNLSTVFANIASIKMPNGNDPRRLRPRAILANPKLFPRAVQLTNAKFIAQAATGGAGTGDVEALISALGYGTPTLAEELAGYESDQTYFVVAEQITRSKLGGLVYIDREPFTVRYYTGRGGGTGVDAILDRADELEWHASGRNAIGYGHPFLIFKCKA